MVYTLSFECLNVHQIPYKSAIAQPNLVNEVIVSYTGWYVSYHITLILYSGFIGQY